MRLAKTDGVANEESGGKIFLPPVRIELVMNAEFVEAKLIEVLEGIQADSGEACPLIVGETKPIEELPQFDSKVWPVAIGMIAAELNINVPDDVNIFRGEDGANASTISEIVARLLALAETVEGISAEVKAQ